MKTKYSYLFGLFFVGLCGFAQLPVDIESLSKLHGDAFVRAQTIETSELASLTEKEEITIQLFSDLSIVAQKKDVVKQTGGGELWQGILIGGISGYLELFSRNGRINGTVYTSSKVYKLNGTSAGSLRVIELNLLELTDHVDEEDTLIQNNSQINRSGKGFDAVVATATNPSIIDVMIVYSAFVQSSVGGETAMENEVHYRIAEANKAFSNSNIYVEFRLVHHQVVNSVPNDASNSDDVKTTEVENLRDQYKADLVSFWNEKGSTGSGSNFNNTPGDPDNGYNTCNFSAVQSQYTFVHECGHNLGAKHDRQTYYDDSPTNSKLELTPYYRYGKSFVGYRSIMSYNNCGELSGGSSGDCERLPYFTNPNIIVNGMPFGVSGNFQTYNPNGPANNAQRINEVAPYVAAYYESNSIEYYNLIVNNGSGSGSYAEGDYILISANKAPQGMVFDQWTGDTNEIADIYSSSTSITISNADISVSAIYKIDNQCINTATSIEAECFDDMFGIQNEDSTENNLNVGYINNGDWMLYENIDLTGMQSIEARVACNFDGGDIEIRIGSTTGELIGTLPVVNTGGNQDWVTISGNVDETNGEQDLYLVFTGAGSGFLFNINYFSFSTETVLSIGEVKTVLSDVSIYPNPVSSTATILNAEGSSITIYNMNGKMVLTKAILNDSETIDMSVLPTGIYYTEVISSSSKSMVKLIKE